MTSYQRLKLKNMELQSQINIFRNALICVQQFDIDIQDDYTPIFRFAYIRNKIMDESAREQLQYWVAENLDEKTIMHLLKLKKELKKNER